MELHERIKYLRKNILKLKQHEFAESLHIKQGALSMIETGVNNSAKRYINPICQTFNISEKWLTTGEGDVFISAPEKMLDNLLTLYNATEEDKSVVQAYLELSKPDRQVILKYMEDVVNKLKEDPNTPTEELEYDPNKEY